MRARPGTGPRALAAFLVAALVLLAVPLGSAVCHGRGLPGFAGSRAVRARMHAAAIASAHAVPSLKCCDDGPPACHETEALDGPGRPEARAAGAQVVPVAHPAGWHPARAVRPAPDAAVFGDGDPPLWLTGCVSRT